MMLAQVRAGAPPWRRRAGPAGARVPRVSRAWAQSSTRVLASPGRVREAGAMADGLVLTRRVSERGVHETAQRAGGASGAAVVRHYVGYEEWPESGFLRREVARHGVALILGFGDAMEVFDGEVGSPVRTLGAFVVGNQSRSSVTGVGGHQLGVQVELTPAGALALFGDVERAERRRRAARRGPRRALGAPPGQLAETAVVGGAAAAPRRDPRQRDDAARPLARGGVAAPAAGRLERAGPGGAAHGRDGLEPASRHRALPAPARHLPQGLRPAAALRARHARC